MFSPLCADNPLVLVLRHAADFNPVFLAQVFVDFDDASIEAIAAAFFAAGDPKLRPGLNVEIIRFEAAAGECLKGATGFSILP